MRRRAEVHLIRLLLLLFTIGWVGAAWGQAGANWDRVKAVDAGTAIRVKGERGRPFACELVQVDDAQLTCSKTRTILFFPVTVRRVFQRGEVREVRLTRRLLSGLGGAAIGIGAGVGLGYALENQATRNEDPGLLQFVFGLLGGVVGEAIGQGSDFLGGPVIYRVP